MSTPHFESGYDPTITLFDQVIGATHDEIHARIARAKMTDDAEVISRIYRAEGQDPNNAIHRLMNQSGVQLEIQE